MDRILIATPVLLTGGTEVHILALASALRSSGAQVQVCCYYEYASAIVASFEENGIEVTLLRLDRDGGTWQLFKVLSGFFRKARPAVVHVQYLAPGLIAVAAARAARVPTVFATVHQLGDAFGFRERLLFSVAVSMCTAFFCVSKAVERSWFGSSALFSAEEAARGRRHFTIYNGVNVPLTTGRSAAMQAERCKAGLGLGQRQVIGIVARLRAEKGHALLLKAFSSVLQANPGVALLVVGDGPDRATLVEQARSLGVLPRIVWAGVRSSEEVSALYCAMDVVAVPSQFEGFGLSAAEAMAAERPVVGTAVGGLTEIVDDGVTGYLIDPDDIAGFAAALARVLDAPALAASLGACGRARVAECFSQERFAAAYIEAYRHFGKRRNHSDDAPEGLPREP